MRLMMSALDAWESALAKGKEQLLGEAEGGEAQESWHQAS